MKKFLLASAVVLCGLMAIAQEPAGQMPEMPKPTQEHAWLKKLVGDWEWTAEMNPPGMPKMTGSGTEHAYMIGDFWCVGESKGTCSIGMPMHSMFTVGYEPDKKQFVGTWVDSMMPQLWEYTGELDEATNTLTLSTEGFCPIRQKMAPFKEVIKLTDADHREFSSSMQNEDGSWSTMVTVKATRKK